jgi:endonuclease G
MKRGYNWIKAKVANILSDELLRQEILDAPHKCLSSGVQARFQPTITSEELRKEAEHYDLCKRTPGITEFETIVLPFGRPVLMVRNNTFDNTAPNFEEPESKVLRDRLEQARPFLEKVIPAVGRIEVEEHPTYDWVGTGWLVAENIVVTNRHVASVFAQRDGGSFKFRRNFHDKTMEGIIDFREEFSVDKQSEFKLIKVLYIEDENGPDIAFFQVEKQSGELSLVPPIKLSEEPVQQDMQVAVIGYPASDSRVTDPALMRRIFGDVFNVKRLAPGEIMKVENNSFLHDCSTLGGNSGSTVLDLSTGKAVGLHFAGQFFKGNYAVPANLIAERLQKLG